LGDLKKCCMGKRKRRGHGEVHPLGEACSHGKLKVCSVTGDRKICARMAHLGVIPGNEIEILCKGGGQECMIKVNGGTLSLDDATAANIMVVPA